MRAEKIRAQNLENAAGARLPTAGPASGRGGATSAPLTFDPIPSLSTCQRAAEHDENSAHLQDPIHAQVDQPMPEKLIHAVKRASPNQHEYADETHSQRGYLHGNTKPAQDYQQGDDTRQPNSAQTGDEHFLNVEAAAIPALFPRQHSPNFGKSCLKIELFVHGQQPKEE
ncbi:MAG: hypothetical protein WCG85_08150 [Polyangia bacterium]